MINTAERKKKIVENCKNHLNKRLAGVQDERRLLRKAAGVNADDNMSESYDSTSQGTLNEMSDLQSHFEFLEESAAMFNRVNFSSRIDTVTSGALVVTDKVTFLIGVSGEFKSDDQEIQGISTASPIFAAMENKKVGDSFTLNVRTYTIEEIS
jgi:transcription elongation GreA/GreB family factor